MGNQGKRDEVLRKNYRHGLKEGADQSCQGNRKIKKRNSLKSKKKKSLVTV